MIRVLVGIVLSPLYWLLAGFYGAPGLRFRLKCAVLGAHLIFNRNSQIPYRTIIMLICWPIDSVRYFEFDFMWGVLSEPSFREYLDVSSPRLFPIILLRDHFNVSAELVNPDKADLAISEALVKACRLSSRCKLRGCLVENAPFAPQSFDLITSISVIEHIREDTEAIRNIWSLLKPGGRLLLSVPCASEAEEEYRNVDYYGVQSRDGEGFFFHQYKYDQSLLEERIYSVTGPPNRFSVFGEKRRGTLQAWLFKRWTGQKYPLWKEPYAIAREFQYYPSLSELPGDGVVAMEFVKR